MKKLTIAFLAVAAFGSFSTETQACDRIFTGQRLARVVVAAVRVTTTPVRLAKHNAEVRAAKTQVRVFVAPIAELSSKTTTTTTTVTKSSETAKTETKGTMVPPLMVTKTVPVRQVFYTPLRTVRTVSSCPGGVCPR